MNIWKSEEFKSTLVILLKKKTLIPILGSGVSCGCHTEKGTVPSGRDYKTHMIKTLNIHAGFSPTELEELPNDSFQQICSYYEDDDNVPETIRIKYLRDNFSGARYRQNDIRKKIFEIEWPYLYTLNLDDAIENSSDYKTKILPNRDYREDIFDNKLCVIKLHGDINEIATYKDGSKVFTSQEYATSLISNSFLLNKLHNDYINQNILIIGCSLNNEIDLLAMKASMPIRYTKENNSSKTIIFIQGEPGKRMQSNFKTYGITDVVWFFEFQDMYSLLINAWNEAQLVQNADLELYENLKIQTLRQADKKNKEYFFMGNTLLDASASTIIYPYFFITRDISHNILRNLTKNKIHIVRGRRVSGKSYLLADIYQHIKDKRVFFFDGTSRISSSALGKLFLLNEIVVLLDIGTISREQFEQILNHSRELHERGNNFIINVNLNDNDTFGIMKWKLDERIIDENSIELYTLPNRWNVNNELKQINNLLPSLGLPAYVKKETFLDHIINAEREFGEQGRFARHKIQVTDIKELSLLIMLAIHEKIYSVDIISFGLENEIIEAMSKYDPYIEREETHYFEKSNEDLSSIKYVLNAKFWLRRELGDFAKQKENHKLIVEAFFYIISKIIQQSRSELYKRKKCRKYILFDVMNDVFLDDKGGQLTLIVNVYLKLNELLANDHNFTHQHAKCLINYARFLHDYDKKVAFFEKASVLAAVAKSIIINAYDDSPSEYLNIALAHVQYTRATALCELCNIEQYANTDHNINAIDAADEALANLYNEEDFSKDSRKNVSAIKIFIERFMVGDLNNIDGNHINKIRELRSYIE